MPNGRFLAFSRRILVGAAALACGGIVSLGMIRQARSADSDFAALRETYQLNPVQPVKKTRCALRQDRPHGFVFFDTGQADV